ncbi:putative Chemotaxis protein CheW [Desulfamplus magnetovallimortis]|uniref:Putative Chemotaxis protein CheW n=1 Tax=Desulfamplus magnetovallimortis TaxID=1246637 RepID=A0A1W1HCA8_9BACT|nr:chemotaxis protein CheW [Desulfamplus magnetovallimortis]SLM30073.1 putative Chemotaxis protein CheW [Desulfamplus magnetovallimortis]
MNRQIATFNLGDSRLGIDILLIKEIYRHMSITPIPDSPPHLKGLMNLRGRVVTVIDLNVCLNRPSSEPIETSRLLVLKTDDEIGKYRQSGLPGNISLGHDIVGLLIDQMDDVITIQNSDILPAPPNLEETEDALIQGVIKQGEELIIILDVNEVLKKIMQACSSTE